MAVLRERSAGPRPGEPRARDGVRRPGRRAPRRPWRAARATPPGWPDRWRPCGWRGTRPARRSRRPGGVVAVLGAVLLEEQPAVDRDLPAGLEVLRARRGLRVEALDVEVAVVALLAGALDGEPQRADRGA